MMAYLIRPLLPSSSSPLFASPSSVSFSSFLLRFVNRRSWLRATTAYLMCQIIEAGLIMYLLYYFPISPPTPINPTSAGRSSSSPSAGAGGSSAFRTAKGTNVYELLSLFSSGNPYIYLIFMTALKNFFYYLIVNVELALVVARVAKWTKQNNEENKQQEQKGQGEGKDKKVK